MKQSLLFIFFILIFSLAPAQDILMTDGTFNRCSGVFSDSGGVGTGAGFNYGNNEDFTMTICPDTPNTFTSLNFTAFSTQATVDILTIYDGDDTTAPVLGTYSGGPANSPGLIFASPTSPTGCLTIRFVTNATGNTTGWSADISCLESCQVIDASIDSTVPAANGNGIIEIPIGTNVVFNGSATYSDDPSIATYNWDFGEGTPANTAMANHTYNTAGTYTVTFTASDTNPTGCSDVETITVKVLGPQIVVDTTTYTVPELVEDVLINSECSLVSNIQFSTGTNFNSENGIGYFTGGVGTFGFTEGIILSTGRAIAANGPETDDQSNGNGSWPGDADLANAIGLNTADTFNASFISFDFTPLNTSINFDFIFASEEYGFFQCTYTDAFAFLLTDNVTGVTTNLAIVPGTTDVVSVLNVRDNAFNGGCASVNPAFFDEFYGAAGQPANTAPTNFIGYSTVMTAQSPVVANRSYSIKLVIADDQDFRYDAAVFLKAGSFDLGGELGDDVTIASGNAQCLGSVVTLDTGVDPSVVHQWSDNNGVIAGETGPTLDVTVSGTYSVEVQFSSICTSTDTVLIEFIDGAIIDNLINLTECDNGVDAVEFDLTVNTPEALGTQDPSQYQIIILR